MDKIKIHELAKKLDKSSKEIIDVAEKLGIAIKSHLSQIEKSDANKIEKEEKLRKNFSKYQCRLGKRSYMPVVPAHGKQR